MHTAQWDHSVELKNKVVGVVGSGLSAIQLIPTIVSQVKELHSFQRTPTWVIPKVFDIKYKKSLRWLQRNIPLFGKLDRWSMLCGAEFVYHATLEGSLLRRFGKSKFLV